MSTQAKMRTFKKTEFPRVHLTLDAWHDMLAITRATDDEVGWFFEVERGEREEFIATKVFLPEQETNGGTTEMQPEQLADFALRHLEEHGDEAYNRLRGWGHSHPKMGTSPSNQDQEMVDELCSAIGEPFVAIRMNQDGQVEADVAYPHGSTFERMSVSLGWPDYQRSAYWQGLVKQRVKTLRYWPKKGQGANQRPTTPVARSYTPVTFDDYLDDDDLFPFAESGAWEDPIVFDNITKKYVPLSQAYKPAVHTLPKGWFHSVAAERWAEKHSSWFEVVDEAVYHQFAQLAFLGDEASQDVDEDEEICDHDWLQSTEGGKMVLFCQNCHTELRGSDAELVAASLTDPQNEAFLTEEAVRRALEDG